MDAFKEASRIKLRFITSKGVLSVEQLWQLSQTELSNCIRSVKKALKKSSDSDDELSFLDSTVVVDKEMELRFDILKDVYLTKQQEAENKRNEKDIKAHNDKILKLIADKKEAELSNLSVEELEKKLIK